MSAYTETWRPGDRVLVRGEQWTVLERTTFEDCAVMRLAPAKTAALGQERTLLTPFDRPVRPDRPSPVAIRRPRRWLHALRRAGAAAHPVGGLTRAAGCGIELLPYQLEPALAMMRTGVARVMIADAVGLGKTIQAALVLAELHARSSSFRALVVSPAGLREQWCGELVTRFRLETAIADAAWLARMSRTLPPDVNPWVLPGLYVSSFDFIKRPEVLHPLESVTWDIVIVDEAHGASLGSARRTAVHAAAIRAGRVMLLTATPHGGDTAEFDALCRIGAASDDTPPMLLFGRSRADVGGTRTRKTRVLTVRLTESEGRMHRLLDSYATQVCREASARGDSRARLAAVTLEKRALSSAGSLGLSVRRRLALLAQESSGPREFQPALPLDEAEGETETGDEPPSSVLAAPGLADANRERRWLSAIAECAENASRAESKARRLLRLVARMQQPVIVFTEFRDTLERLYVLLARPGRDLKRLHGGLSPRERVLVIDEFRDRGGTLLATDAASEGLNLHPTCHVVIHYELPWSPARLEQRTGRVDRIGQRHTVHEILLVARDTAERVVLAPLARRAARARSAAGSFSHLLSALSDSRVAEAVMDGRPLDSESGCEAASEVAGACSPPETLAGEAAEEAARIKQQRDWLLASPPLKPDGGTVATTVRLRKSQSRPVVICVYAIALVTRAGASVWRRVACAREAWPAGAAIRTAADARSLASAFLEGRETELRAGILAAHASEIEANARMHARALQSEEERERSMAEALPSAASELVQAGLFDRRALKELEARRVAAHALLDGTRIRMGALKKDRTLETIVELTAILFVPGDSP